MFSTSPGKNSLVKSSSLRKLDDLLKNNIYKCLCQPFSHHKRCTFVFSRNDESLSTAIQEARSELSAILAAGHLIQAGGLHGTITRLERIAKAFCCSKHGDNPDDIKTFAYYWVVCELIDDFLSRRGWSWDASKWQCLASNYHETCAGLKQPVKVSDREIVYRSLIQLAVYATFSEDLDDLFLTTAIKNLVSRWICVDYKKAADNVEAIEAQLEEEMRRICGHYPPHGLQEQSHLGTPPIPVSSELIENGTINESSPSPAALLSPDWNQTGSGGFAVRRRSAPMVMSSSSLLQSTPTTPDRPPPVRSAASDATTFRQHSSVTWLPASSEESVQSPSYASRNRNSTVPNMINFIDTNEKKKTPREIVNAVLAIIKQEARGGSSLYQDGWIYILQIPDHPGYVKIGRTTQSATSRKQTIAKCKRDVNIEIVGAEGLALLGYHERLEKIIHADLYNERCYFRCPCSITKKQDSHNIDGLVKHGEWFKIDANDAVRRVEQWRNWMRQDPYVKAGAVGEGKVKDDFKRRVIYCEREKVSIIPEQRWEMFMTPFYMD